MAPKSTCRPSDSVIACLDTMRSELTGMLVKLVAANAASAIEAELNEAALNKVRSVALGGSYEENSRRPTRRHGVPDLNALGVERQACPHYQQIVRRMQDYLQSHYHQPIQLGDVASALKMNACYLSSLFSATTGVTYNRYLQELRLAKAKELLAAPGSHIGEVAGATGFASAATFCRTFKARTGLSPRAWRDGVQAAIDDHF